MEKETYNELLERGVDEVLGKEELIKKIESKKVLRVKLGIDPTSPNLHIGRSIPLLKLRDFQKLGHKVVFIVGDFTGVIGDTSDKESERPMLEREVIEENKKSYFSQVGKLIDLEKAELRYNSEWLATLTYGEIGEHANCFSVADFISRENIRKRLDEGKRVSLREMLYPLMQGYDSVAIEADVELGGTDQRFNILAGRTLQSHYGQDPQTVITNPLVAGLDGRKMSSSWGNTINLNDEPSSMYGKVMSLKDDFIVEYFTLCTRVPLDEVAVLKKELHKGVLHPKEAKMKLAREIVTLYHTETKAKKAEEVFIQTFQEREIPQDINTVHVKKGSFLSDVLIEQGVVNSKSHWRRLVDGGGVHDITNGNDVRVNQSDYSVESTLVLRVGKRTFIKMVV